ncbi:MAG: molybdopterin-guanine dinucleotide biosynthesis protein MobB [Desulfobulbaceae bacterium]|nr:molybdopterin-guanine dinucleotide biosynthesis protein MobB [Desulfobulbaceae bacterium]
MALFRKKPKLPYIITFIGWHNSGKTTVASRVVAILKKRGLNPAVVKSTKEEGLLAQAFGTDTDIYLRSGADTVMLAAPDGTSMVSRGTKPSLTELSTTYFSNFELVVGEGFKHEKGIAKIEINRSGEHPLWKDDPEIIGLVSDAPSSHPFTFGSLDFENIADFIISQMHGQN